MTIKSKRALTIMISGIILLAAFIGYLFLQRETMTLQSLSVGILIFIGITILLNVIVQIIFHIFLAISIAVRDGSGDEEQISRKISSSVKDDEMEKQITSKSHLPSVIAGGIGYMASLVILALGGSALWMVNFVFIGFSIGSIVGEGVKIYFYERGL